MGAYNTDGGDTVERNYTVSSSILDLVVNYLEEALQIIGNPSEEIPKLIEMSSAGSKYFITKWKPSFQLWYDPNWNYIVESNVRCCIEVRSHSVQRSKL